MARSRKVKSKGKGGCGFLIPVAAVVGWIGACVGPRQHSGTAGRNPIIPPGQLLEANSLQPPQSVAATDPGREGSKRLYAGDRSEISSAASWHPQAVTFTESVLTPSGTIGAGQVGNLEGIDGEMLWVRFRGVLSKIPASATDLAEQMAAVHSSP